MGDEPLMILGLLLSQSLSTPSWNVNGQLLGVCVWVGGVTGRGQVTGVNGQWSGGGIGWGIGGWQGGAGVRG